MVKSEKINTPLILNFSGIVPEAGCDEAGRGCLAGPVFAAAVIFPEGYFNPFLNDSKQLSETRRDRLRIEIQSDALAWAVGMASVDEIGDLNILRASILAMHRAVEGLSVRPAFLIVDGNRFHPIPGLPHSCQIKGDSRFQSIAAASILAKTHRDEFMVALDAEFPDYGWGRNKGYPTADHREAISRVGSCSWHRRGFRLLKEQSTIDWSWTDPDVSKEEYHATK